MLQVWGRRVTDCDPVCHKPFEEDRFERRLVLPTKYTSNQDLAFKSVGAGCVRAQAHARVCARVCVRVCACACVCVRVVRVWVIGGGVVRV
jgi:hypothetical protein